MQLSFHANGKLLLSGEYFVLDGAEAIGLPARFGQSLEVQQAGDADLISWKSKNADRLTWFECNFRKTDLSILKTTDLETATTLQHILKKAKTLNPDFLKDPVGLNVQTQLQFPRLWGLGSSSTLINTVAKWARIDPFQLSAETLGGSGYDIACAGSVSPILYQLKNSTPTFKSIAFAPPFAAQLYFVYLNKKQNSRKGIQKYREQKSVHSSIINDISKLSHSLLEARTLTDFQKLIVEHEKIVSRTIGMPRAQDLYFPDFDGTVKSLGAWGGDFILAASPRTKEEVKAYFNKKGFEVLLEYKEMVRSGD